MPKAKVLINGLSFNAQGKRVYGKPTEVAKAHVKQIVVLPSITHHNFIKITNSTRKS